jgi:mannose-1-phosphate guanylyltransferase
MGVDGVHVARDFHEKPDFEAATQFLFAGDYYWNSSHYCFSVETLLEAYRQAAPRLVEAISEYVETGLASAYVSADSPAQELMPFIASGHPIGVVASSFTWSDLGTWPSLYRALAGPDGSAVVASGRTFDTDSTASLVVNDSRMTVITAGLEGVAVVVSGSIVLVLPMKRLEDDPSILESLRARFDRDIHEDPRENSV